MIQTCRRLGFLIALGALALFVTAHVANADTLNIDFETYSLGTIDGQDGWVSTGSVGGGCAMYDVAVDSSFGYGTFGTKSLRISNAVTSGCFTDQTYSKSLVDEAGEASAANDGYSGGTRQSHFEAQWEFASTLPGGEQPGLQVVASPDRGDGARMSWIQMADTPTGLEVNFYDYQSGLNAVGCDEANFIESNAANGLSRAVPHTIKITVDFKPGPANDDVKVYVDGVLKLNKRTSWEDYFRECEGNPTRTVDSLLFRVGGTAAPATAGYGFVIDNVTYTSRPSGPEDVKVGGIVVDQDTSALALQSDASSGSRAWFMLTTGIAIAAASAIAFGGGVWYVRRRRIQ